LTISNWWSIASCLDRMTTNKEPWIHELSEDALGIFVDTRIYMLEVLFRACYIFTDRCYLFLEPSEEPDVINVRFSRKAANSVLSSIAAEFCNELVNQRVRQDIARETKPIRELIVAQAFAEADLIDRSDSEASYIDDPRHIGVTK
jgi:His-Xaa-Ser system protein HxsD